MPQEPEYLRSVDLEVIDDLPCGILIRFRAPIRISHKWG